MLQFCMLYTVFVDFFCGPIAKSKWLTTERVVFIKALQSVVKDRYNEAAQKKREISCGRAGGKL